MEQRNAAHYEQYEMAQTLIAEQRRSLMEWETALRGQAVELEGQSHLLAQASQQERCAYEAQKSQLDADVANSNAKLEQIAKAEQALAEQKKKLQEAEAEQKRKTKEDEAALKRKKQDEAFAAAMKKIASLSSLPSAPGPTPAQQQIQQQPVQPRQQAVQMPVPQTPQPPAQQQGQQQPLQQQSPRQGQGGTYEAVAQALASLVNAQAGRKEASPLLLTRDPSRLTNVTNWLGEFEAPDRRDGFVARLALELECSSFSVSPGVRLAWDQLIQWMEMVAAYDGWSSDPNFVKLGNQCLRALRQVIAVDVKHVSVHELHKRLRETERTGDPFGQAVADLIAAKVPKKPSKPSRFSNGAKTTAVCDHCKKRGHKSPECWTKYPDKAPGNGRGRAADKEEF